MREKGMVIKQEQGMVLIQLIRHEACQNCGACSMGAQDQEMIITAENHCQAKVGDWVYLDLEQSNFFKAVGIMYGLPLISLLLGLLLGYGLATWIGQTTLKEPLALLFALMMMAITFLWIRSKESKWSKQKFRPIAVEIVKKVEEA
ncbi:MAG: SoxR reducing system RseC family protein [Epulopiscium sp.]|nr:SoxR reducing system RseC family protein [Candidatus Epulonipiscium sp.]